MIRDEYDELLQAFLNWSAIRAEATEIVAGELPGDTDLQTEMERIVENLAHALSRTDIPRLVTDARRALDVQRNAER